MEAQTWSLFDLCVAGRTLGGRSLNEAMGCHDQQDASATCLRLIAG